MATSTSIQSFLFFLYYAVGPCATNAEEGGSAGTRWAPLGLSLIGRTECQSLITTAMQTYSQLYKETLLAIFST